MSRGVRYLGAFAATGRSCRCTPEAVARYQGRLSGPLLDLIDLQIEVPAVKPAEFHRLDEPKMVSRKFNYYLICIPSDFHF